MSLILQLQPYDNQSYYFDREQFITTFPESVIARAVDLDPTTELVQIPNRDVTPDAVEYLQGLLQEGYPDPPRTVNTNSTGKYLGIDLLGVVADDQYPTFALQNPDINLLDPGTWNYKTMIEFSIKFDYLDLAEYVFNRTHPEDTKDVDNLALVQASFVGRYPIVRDLLKRDVDAKTARATFEELVRVDPNYFEDNPFYMTLKSIVGRESVELGPIHLPHFCIDMASYAGHQNIVDLFLKAYSDIDYQEVLLMALLGDQLGLIQWLVTQPGMTPEIIRKAFIESFQYNRTTSYDTYEWLITNVDAIHNLNWNVWYYFALGDPSYVDILVNDPLILPTLNQNTLTAILGEAMSIDRPDIAKIVLPLLAIR